MTSKTITELKLDDLQAVAGGVNIDVNVNQSLNAQRYPTGGMNRPTRPSGSVMNRPSRPAFDSGFNATLQAELL